jgi:hypothetical protein
MTLGLNCVALIYTCSCCQYKDSNLLGRRAVSTGKYFPVFLEDGNAFLYHKDNGLQSFDMSVNTRV